MSPPWVAAHSPLARDPSTLDRPVFLQRLDRVLAARGLITASRRKHPRGAELPCARDEDEQTLHLRRGPRWRGGSPLPAAARARATSSSSRNLANSRSIPPSRPIRT